MRACPYKAANYLWRKGSSILVVTDGKRFGTLFDCEDPSDTGIWPEIALTRPNSDLPQPYEEFDWSVAANRLLDEHLAELKSVHSRN